MRTGGESLGSASGNPLEYLHWLGNRLAKVFSLNPVNNTQSLANALDENSKGVNRQ